MTKHTQLHNRHS